MTTQHGTAAQIREARGWLEDCGAPVAKVRRATDDQIVREVQRQYDGGWRGFVQDGRELWPDA